MPALIARRQGVTARPARTAQRSVQPRGQRRMRELGEVLKERLRSVSHGFTVSPFYRFVPAALVFLARAAGYCLRDQRCPPDQGPAARLVTPLTHLRSV